MSEFVLELRNIMKEFSGVKALTNVNFDLKKGEIHALMGENGAGKSTFIKIITGVHEPNEGEMIVRGEKVRFKNPREAKALGIAAIYQHVTNYPDLTVTENIFMGHEKISPITRRLLWKEMHEEARKILQQLGSNIHPTTQMSALSVAQQQIVEIAKAISTKADIIIMDEPTAALTTRESEELYKIAEKLRDDGASIIFISHRFEDMYRLASRVTVLRDSNYIGTWEVNELSNDELIIQMVGRQISQIFPEKNKAIGETVLEVKNLARVGYFKDISFEVRKGEILGITGLVGAGRTEVCQSIFGIERIDTGEIIFKGRRVTIQKPRDSMDLGISYLAEDRQLQGLILSWEISRNITLPNLSSFSRNGWLNKEKEYAISKELGEKVNVKANSVFDLVSSLSGGNQQKVAFAKLLTLDVEVIILDEPTKGVDVGAKAAIYEIINGFAESGYAVILVSSEMPEILGLSDRILVMREGRIVKAFASGEATQEKILAAAMSVTNANKRLNNMVKG